MSSSHRKKARSKVDAEVSTKVLPCPECGMETLERMTGDCTLLDGTVIKNLSRYHCSNCGADLFDQAAMREIRKQRGKKVEA